MILDQTQASIAYRCPHCGTVVKSVVGIFKLTADTIRLKCPCKNSFLDMTYTKDKKIRLSVPCFICPNPHSFLISSGMFFDKDVFSVVCPYSGIDICFIGQDDKVDEKIEESEKELLELLGDTDFKSLSAARESEKVFSDPQVLEIVMYVIRELEDEGKIYCRCGEDGGEYEVEVGDDSVSVRCKKCGAETSVPANSVSSAQAFLNADSLKLT